MQRRRCCLCLAGLLNCVLLLSALSVQAAGPGSYAASLAALDNRLAAARAVLPGFQSAQLVSELLAERAGITGSYADYAAAEAALAVAREGASVTPELLLDSAELSFALRRLDAMEMDLAEAGRALLLSPGDRARLLALHGDLAYHRGDYAAALAGYRAALELDRQAGYLLRLADYYWHTGGYPEAAALLGAAERMPGVTLQACAMAEQMRGSMAFERGDAQTALACYQRAEDLFPGWPLIGEHLARAQDALGIGGSAGSVARWEALAGQTGAPEYIDELAKALRRDGQLVLARRWIVEAGRRHAANMAQYPELAIGNALNHELAFGRDPQAALALAQQNAAYRPTGLAQVKLAQAAYKARDYAAARSAVEAALATPYRSPALHAIAAKAYSALGEPRRALEQRALALALNPKVKGLDNLDVLSFGSSHP